MTNSESEQQKLRRRGVLKAVAGAPVIFTLSAGANVAAASITCKDKSRTLASSSNPPVPGATVASDTWVRYQVQRKQIKISNTPSSGSTIVSDAFTLNSHWYRVDTNGVVTNVDVLFEQDKGDETGFYYLLVDHANYPATDASSYVYLGTVVGSPIAGASCWNSITLPPGNNTVPTTNILP